MGNAARGRRIRKTLYITDNSQLNSRRVAAPALITGHSDTLYVYNVNTGWTTYRCRPARLPPAQSPPALRSPIAAGAGAIADAGLMVPSVGAYLRGNPTVAHTWCPGTVGNAGHDHLLPAGRSQCRCSRDVLAATTGGSPHSGRECQSAAIRSTLYDIGVTIPHHRACSGDHACRRCRYRACRPCRRSSSPARDHGPRRECQLRSIR